MLNAEDKKIINLIKDYVRFMDINIRNMVLVVSSWINKDEEKMKEYYEKVKHSEEDTKNLKNKIMIRVSENQASMHRTDFLRLISRFDTLADFSEGVAARIMKLDFAPDGELSEKILPLIKAINGIGAVFKKAITSLIDNPQMTLDYCNQIDALEKETDIYYRELEAWLFKSNMDIKRIIWLRIIMKQIEEAGDLAQSSADAIRIIFATS